MPIKSLNNKDSYYNYLAESGSLQGTLYNWGGNRGIWAGGSNGGPYEVTIDYVSIPTTGNASDFGDLSDARQYPAGVSNGQRGVIAGGDSGPRSYNVGENKTSSCFPQDVLTAEDLLPKEDFNPVS